MEEIVEMTLLGADVVRRFGMDPKVALISHQLWQCGYALCSKDAGGSCRDRVPDWRLGEMHADLL